MKKTPLKRISNKRRKQLAEYSVLRREFLVAHPYCQVYIKEQLLDEEDIIIHNGLIPGTMGHCFVPWSTEIHHKNKRFGSRLNDTTQWMAVSKEGHEWIENNKSLARERGYLNNF